MKEGYRNQFLGGDNSVLKVFLIAAALAWLVSPSRVCSQVSCTNPIVCENALTGNPQSEWDITGSGDPSIQGFATDISVNRGQTINFKINTTAASYRVDVYRLGYYGGLGARKVATITPTASLPQTQPPCVRDASTGLVDCGDWALSASWAVPTNATSGVYIARPVRLDTGGASHIVFIVRDDAGRSDLLFQTSDTTWQAYNSYGGGSLYPGPGVIGPGTLGQSFKVSYNRPFNTRDGSISGAHESFPFTSEYPMIRWLEMNGYNASYASGVDTDRRGSAALTQHKAVLSVGHDEYWSGQQRTNVEAARAAGVNLGFFSGNEIFWKTRWENSIDGNATSYRTLVCYKETWANSKIDPTAAWTGTWRDPRFSPPSDGGRPENALSGQMVMVNAFRHDPIFISSDQGKLRFWRNTGLATLGAGQTAQLPAGVLGYEWDEALDNGFLPAGLIRLSTTSIPVDTFVIDYGGLPRYAQRTATHNLTLYRHSSGSLVFGAGTTQWAWGLDTTHDLFAQTLLTMAVPAMENCTDNVPYELGLRVMSDIAGQVTALRFWKCTRDTGTHMGHVWNTNGQLLASITFANETASGWQQQALSGPLAIGSNTEYVVSVSTGPGGYLPATLNVFGTPLVNGHLSTPAGDSGRFGLAGTFPTSSSPHNYFRDLVFVPGNAGPDSRMQQATVNILADMGAQPGTLQPGLVIASPSTDTIAPTSVISTPTPGTVTADSLLILGTATDAGGGRVAAVEFSVDGGTTWHPASGTTNWTATWTATPPSMTIRSRATDDSGRIENPGPGVTLTVNSSYTLWPPVTTPSVVDVGVPGAVELGVKFQSDTTGWITALRFYKSAANTGIHVGNLWGTNGTLFATVTFAGETTSGWQEAPLPFPVLITSNTTYVASYHTDSGDFSIDAGYFATSSVNRPPLHAPADGIVDGNGMYQLGASAFPADKSQANNYWVDVVFAFGIQTAIPVFAPPAGTYGGPGFITLLDATPGAQIYYTTDGSTPTNTSTLYTGPIRVTTTTTNNAIAVVAGWSNSTVASAIFTLQAVPPTFNPIGGTYSVAQSVMLSNTSPGAQIYYTTNGRTPTISSTRYTGPIAVSTTTTIKAIAVVSGWNNSKVATAAYTVLPKNSTDEVL